MPTRRTVFFISDRTGITAEMLGNSLLTQLEDFQFRRITVPFIDSPEKVEDVIRVFGENLGKAQRLVARLARDFPRQHQLCPVGSDRALDGAILTAPDKRDPKLLAKLDAVAGRLLRPS